MVLSPSPVSFASGQPTPSIKASIRDMMRVQQQDNLPDELFWEIFNLRVLLNEEIDVLSYAQHHSGPPPRS